MQLPAVFSLHFSSQSVSCLSTVDRHSPKRKSKIGFEFYSLCFESTELGFFGVCWLVTRGETGRGV